MSAAVMSLQPHAFTRYEWLPKSTSGTSTKHRALCIACAYPGTSYELHGTVKDQEALKKGLEDNGYSVTFLSDADDKHAVPTKANILKEIANLCDWLNEEKGRMGWISYAGHGTQTKATVAGEEPDGKDEAMVPTDYPTAGLLTDNELNQTMLKSHKVQNGCAMIIFMDCCHSASILDIPYALETEPVGPKYVEDKSIGDIFGVSAAADDKVAYETAAGGVCTRAFIEAVRKLGKGALPAEILLEMRQYAKDQNMDQLITMHSNRQFTFGDFQIMKGVDVVKEAAPPVSAPPAPAPATAPSPAAEPPGHAGYNPAAHTSHVYTAPATSKPDLTKVKGGEELNRPPAQAPPTAPATSGKKAGGKGKAGTKPATQPQSSCCVVC